MDEMKELGKKDFSSAMKSSTRRRIVRGDINAKDIVALRHFIGLTQEAFATAMGISVHTLRNWEQGRRHPEGPAIALLRIAARHPGILRQNLSHAA